jgi:hypothetical protein
MPSALAKFAENASRKNPNIPYLAADNVFALLLHRLEMWDEEGRERIETPAVFKRYFQGRAKATRDKLDIDSFVYNKYGSTPNDAEIFSEFKSDGGEKSVMQAAEDLRDYLRGMKQGTVEYNDALDAFIELHQMKQTARSREGMKSVEENSQVIPFDSRKVQLEVGPGSNALFLLDSFRKHDADKHFILVENNKDMALLAQRYAEKLGLKNVSVLHADASKDEFRSKVAEALGAKHGGRKVDIIHAGRVLRYINLAPRGLESFLKHCHGLLGAGGVVHIEEQEFESNNEEYARARGAHIVKEGGKTFSAFYSLEYAAERAGFDVVKHELHTDAARGAHMRKSVLRKP